MRVTLATLIGLPGEFWGTAEKLGDWLRELAVYEWGSSVLHTGTVFAISGFAGFVDGCPAGAAEMLDQFTLAARIGIVAGHPMLLLVTAPQPLDELFREQSVLADYDPPRRKVVLFPVDG